MLRRHLCPVFIPTLFTIAKKWKQSKYPSIHYDKHRKNVLHRQNDILFSLFKNEVTLMELEIIMLNEVGTERYHRISYMKSENVNHMEVESRMVVQRQGEWKDKKS
jgi:hypothetical protein